MSPLEDRERERHASIQTTNNYIKVRDREVRAEERGSVCVCVCVCGRERELSRNNFIRESDVRQRNNKP